MYHGLFGTAIATESHRASSIVQCQLYYRELIYRRAESNHQGFARMFDRIAGICRYRGCRNTSIEIEVTQK
jgi:hypothetical protein